MNSIRHSFNSSMTGVTSEAETANTEHQSSPPVFSGVRGAQSLVFGVVFCISLFWPLWYPVLLRFTAFDIFKIFLHFEIYNILRTSIFVSFLNRKISSSLIRMCVSDLRYFARVYKFRVTIWSITLQLKHCYMLFFIVYKQKW